VLLIEKTSKIGGNLWLASAAPTKREVELVLPYFEALLERLPIEVRLQTALDASILETFGPDLVILATGTVPETTDLPGLKPERYSTYRDVLAGEIPTGKNVVVLDGGMIGIETAEYLSCHDKLVTILESGSRLGHDLYPLVAREVIKLVSENGDIRVQLETTPERIEGERLICRRDGQTVTIACDHIVSARRKPPEGAGPADFSERDLGSARIIGVGDCKSPGKIMDAVHEAYRIAMSIGERGGARESVGGPGEPHDPKSRIASKIKSGSFSLEDIPDYLEILVKACNGNLKIQKKSKQSRLKFQFAIQGAEDYWITVDRGRFSTGAGGLENPDVTIRMGAEIAPGIFAGSVNAASAYMTKELAFMGPMRHGIAFRNWINVAKEEMGL
jgi:putative sterol carrier protein